MRFFHEQVKTDCVYCHGGGCVHCANRQIDKIVGHVDVGVLDVGQLERLVECFNSRMHLELRVNIVVPGAGDAAVVWGRFHEGPPAFMVGGDGSVQSGAHKVAVPASRDTRGRLRALLAKMERGNPEPEELKHARRMLSDWMSHRTGYAAEQAAHWRGEVERLEAEMAGARIAGSQMTEAVPGPLRIVLQRTRGWRMPGNTVKVDRATKWGNPFKVGSRVTGVPGLCRGGAGVEHVLKSAAEAVHCYQCWLAGEVNLYNQRPPSRGMIQHELRGKNLACWCKAGDACHADVLLGMANGEEAHG